MMIFFMMAAVVVAISSGYTIFLIYRKKTELSGTAGIIIDMNVAAMTALLTGFISGAYSGDMFLSAGISMIIGFIAGFLTGQPLGIMAILGGAVAGLISGLVGTILGILLQFTSPVIMLCVLMALYALIIGLTVAFILVESDDKWSLDTRNISPFAILSAGVIILTLFLFLYSSGLVTIPGEQASAETQSQTNQASLKTEIDVTEKTHPIVKLMVTQAGYSPSVIRVKKGSKVNLEIHNPLEDTCLTTFSIPDFQINNVNLKLGITNLSFIPDKTGVYSFSCGMQMFKGTIIVE